MLMTILSSQTEKLLIQNAIKNALMVDGVITIKFVNVQKATWASIVRQRSAIHNA